MQNSDPHVQIARKIRAVEVAKIGIVEQVAEVFRGIQSGSERELAQALGELIGIAYFLGVQLDVPLEMIDRAAHSGVPKSLGHDAIDSADFESVMRYLGSKR